MIDPNELRLTGTWVSPDGKLIADEICDRIMELVEGYLMKVGSDAAGWETLYRDPTDGRLWELTYSQSQLHGGGPPELRNITVTEAKRKYGYSPPKT